MGVWRKGWEEGLVNTCATLVFCFVFLVVLHVMCGLSSPTRHCSHEMEGRKSGYVLESWIFRVWRLDAQYASSLVTVRTTENDYTVTHRWYKSVIFMHIMLKLAKVLEFQL